MKPQPRYHRGDRIANRYRVHQALLGGMGEVYLCLDLETNYPYALKTFQQRYLTDPHRLRRAFEQEVATWVALEKHPNIVRCFYMTTLDNQPFMLLEWIAGEEGKGTDLRSWLRHGPLDLQIALQIAIDVCNGLLHAQTKRPGIVHRDLKPENILIAQGGLAKITDFGLVQIVAEAEFAVAQADSQPNSRHSLVGHNGIAGTPAYMAPEQWRGESLDGRTDIYALGCILYELLTGDLPFPVTLPVTIPNRDAVWLDTLHHAHEHAPVPPLPSGLPATLNEIVQRCLAKAASARYAQVTDLLSHLTALYQAHFHQAPRPQPGLAAFTAVDYNNRGVTYAALGQREAALSDYIQAITLDPTYAKAYCNRGNTYDALGQREAALSDYTQAITLDPAYANAYYNRGVTYAALGQQEAALSDYTQAITLDPTYAQAYANRGNTYAALGQYEAALSDYTQALTLDPTHAQAYANRGNTYAALGQREAALADYTQAIHLNPTYAQAYYNRGISYDALGQREAALTDFAQALTLDPTFAQAYVGIGALLCNQGRLVEALPYFEKAAQLGAPEGTQYAAQARQMLGLDSAPPSDPAQVAFDAFQQADSLTTMQQAVTRFPLLLQPDFIAAIEQTIAEQAPPEYRPAFIQRLTWLRQIANLGAKP